VRASLPVNTYPTPPDGDKETGLGDFNVFAAYLIDTGNPSVSFGIGPQLTSPTAIKDELGSEKWSAGIANVLFKANSPKIRYGYLLTRQASFAGDDDREDVNVVALQSFAFYQLGGCRSECRASHRRAGQKRIHKGHGSVRPRQGRPDARVLHRWAEIQL
jgi:hypothetical protein